MKKFGLLLLALVFVAACSNQETNLEIQGKVQGLKKGTLYLQKIEDTALVTIDSVVVKGDETFSFKTFIESPQVLYLYLNKKDNSVYNDRIRFFAEPGEMIVNTTLKNFEGDVIVEGSENHERLMEYEQMMQRFNSRNLELIQRSLAAQESEDQDSLDATDMEYESLIKRRYLYTVNFALNNKDREIAPFLAISEVYDANIKYLDTIYSALTPEVKESLYGKSLQDFLEERRALEKQTAEDSVTKA
ncbi:DUF4369 domain-containing protein [Salinimicrobium oceani]|uniref:DUF4369 domain-containing protein n=1 Tax=Salinimicrobium oceani TaxID=2722702 RepID=A0ABX1CTW9_9FLAO|nr:DUF4369 domain-containing protein [Salinimicrobium oceani]NJW51739.1 DUF4369 domain-containing protein [Salinimicrobium oceani]